MFTAAADGSNPKRITPFDLQCCAQWAPGGKQIFISASAPDDNEWMTAGRTARSGRGRDQAELARGSR